jgi:formylglycine-generating enzyme required for sulfatase activity
MERNMKTVNRLIRGLVLTLPALASFTTSTQAQTVSIPDPGLNAAIRSALHIPTAPLTAQDLLTLTNLDASRRNVKSTVGLDAARNLVSLNLQINQLTNFSIPTTLTNLLVLDLTGNPLPSFSPPGVLTNLASLTAEGCGLTNLTIPATLTGLTNLDVEGNNISSFNLPSNLTSLVFLDLGFNSFTNFSLPGGLTNLSSFYFAGNPLTNVTLPPDLSGMTELNMSQSLLTRFTPPAGMTNLEELDLSFNQLTSVTLPADLRSLSELELDFNRLSVLNLPNLTNLSFLHLRANLFTNFSLPAGLTGLTYLDVSDGPLRAISLPAGLNRLSFLRIRGNTNLTSLTLPLGMTNLTGLNLTDNRLTHVVLPPDLNHLQTLDLGGNLLASLTLPAGLTNLTGLFVVGNLLTNLTLPPDMTHLVSVSFLFNPLTSLVLSEPLAASTNFILNVNDTVASLRNQGVSVFTYPLEVQLVRPEINAGAFKFGITGPPAVYAVLGSTNLTVWNVLGAATNPLGSVNFHDVTANLSPQKFYRALLQDPPANMVFIPSNMFTMGSPTNELDRATDEGPQTTVILTRGFWIGQYEVTQGEYLSVMGTNPSPFPGDLSRPVTSVSWPEATNYCAKLTQQELEAGRIPAGSHYRLPTEAEWECAARAGTTTRFSYGDDPAYASLGSHAWYAANSGFTPHSIGQKLPNPWGLYDMEGNVVEWCQDWFGLLPGGIQTDPTGPASSPSGRKVTRGGAFDNTQQSCRSAERSLFNAGPFDTDTDLGFRVVLVAGPQ